jgi:hypothetical protein
LNCLCPPGYIQSTTEGNIICTKTTVLGNIFCPDGCTTVVRPNGTVYCDCTDTVEPVIEKIETSIYFDNKEFFKEVSWTISYKPTEGAWNSYFTFYPDYTPFHQEYFQTGYNWGDSKETLWNHTFNNDSFCVFQGKYNPWMLEFPIVNENVNKILNSISINVEAKRFSNHWDFSLLKDVGITDMYIYNNTNNTGNLVVHPQKTITDSNKYPKTEGDKQHIMSTNIDGKQNINYFYNRVINQNNNIPMFLRDENNIFKTINSRTVMFTGKRVLERMRGESFIVHLSNTKDSSFNISIKNTINNETLYE